MQYEIVNYNTKEYEAASLIRSFFLLRSFFFRSFSPKREPKSEKLYSFCENIVEIRESSVFKTILIGSRHLFADIEVAHTWSYVVVRGFMDGVC